MSKSVKLSKNHNPSSHHNGEIIEGTESPQNVEMFAQTNFDASINSSIVRQ